MDKELKEYEMGNNPSVEEILIEISEEAFQQYCYEDELDTQERDEEWEEMCIKNYRNF